MKKILLVVACVLAAQLSMAQDEAFKKDVMKLLEINGSGASMDVAKTQILKMIPAAKQDAFLIEFNASLPSFYEKIAKVYMEVYTKQDVKDMIAFYESPVGKKMAAKAGEVTEKSQAAGAEWGQSLQPMMMKYMGE
ncbi:DUF2059 domain-containing protein [Flavobacterium longum]|uniref:DUF2059 domain-containing protein n=1 Tax=Flavobacterium longum TaxID=1299340 RepID=UPI0039EC529A